MFLFFTKKGLESKYFSISRSGYLDIFERLRDLGFGFE